MTKQIDDTLVFEGDNYLLRGWPLESYWKQANRPRKPEFKMLGSMCWRGYRAAWRISEGALYLTEVGTGSASTQGDAGHTTIRLFVTNALNDIFPSVNGPVLADWVSDEFYMELADKSLPQMARTLVIKHGHITSTEQCEVAETRSRADAYRAFMEGRS